MIRFIAAMDSKGGLANNHGIPWQGKLPTDVAFFRSKTTNNIVLMGHETYDEFKQPLSKRRNLVASRNLKSVRPGFEVIHDARKFLSQTKEEVWNIGGAGLFAATLDLADELYITQLGQDFNCTKFFPEFKDKFEKVSETQPQTENGITFTFQVWRPKT
ncbi:MAG TPA: dihydrofolate reductase [Patescibacteria group bacterium]|nr:dihydrofolate reductase [Patescibacteria group bacterium]